MNDVFHYVMLCSVLFLCVLLAAGGWWPACLQMHGEKWWESVWMDDKV